MKEMQIALIGIGGEGCRMVHTVDIPEGWNVDRRLWDSCVDSLDSLGEDASEQREPFGLQITHGMGCGGQTELGRSVFLQEQEKCLDAIEGKDLVLFLGSLGGGFATGFLPEVARLTETRGIPTLALVKLPFSFEGRKCMETARQALGKLRESCMAVPTFEGDQYLGWIGEDGLASPAVERMDNEVELAVVHLCHLLLEDGLYEFDLLTMKSVFDLDVAKTLVFCSSCEDLETGIRELEERYEEQLSNADFRVDRLLVSTIGSQKMGADEVNQVNRRLSEKLGNPDKSFYGACVAKSRREHTIAVFASVHLGQQFELSEFKVENAGSQTLESTSSSRKKSVKRPKSKPGKREKKAAEEDSQGFFDHILRESNRGYFENTPPNNWNGIDLDVPTYIRRGIRIKG